MTAILLSRSYSFTLLFGITPHKYLYPKYICFQVILKYSSPVIKLRWFEKLEYPSNPSIFEILIRAEYELSALNWEPF